jgi:hypothetical protein
VMRATSTLIEAQENGGQSHDIYIGIRWPEHTI